jgi:hypothetical protein
MHTDKKLFLQSILLEPKFGRRQEKRETEQIVKCLLSDLEHCTFCSVLDNRILARGFRGDHPQMSLQTCHKCHFRRPTLTPHRSIHSVFIRSWIHLSISQLAQHARHEIRSAGFTSSQNSAHRNLRSHLLLSQIKPQKNRNSDSIRVSENDFDAHFRDRHQGTIAGRKKERLIAAPRENVWQWITDDDDERHYPVCLRFTLYVSEEETRNPNLCVFVQRGQITNGEEPLCEFWMNEEKGLHLGRNGVPSI